MAQKTAEIHIRIEPELKKKAEAIFEHAGYTPSRAIAKFYQETVKRGRMTKKLWQRREPNIPCLDDLTVEEVNELLAEAEKGEAYSLEEVEKMMEEEYGFRLRV